MSQNIFRQSTKTKKHQINLTYVRVYYLLLTYFIEKKNEGHLRPVDLVL